MRCAACHPVEPVEMDVPYARSVAAVERSWTIKTSGQSKTETRFFLSSLTSPSSGQCARVARGHWGIENRNHYKRDTSLWLEDKCRHRRANAALNLALTRNALLALIPFQQGQPLDEFFERYHRHPPQAIRLVLSAKPVP